MSTGKVAIIIDDDPDICTLARKILEGNGYTVHTANSVAEGLDIAEKKIPHIIITDLNMPKETGFDLLQKKLTNPQLQNVPTIVLSGLKDKHSVLKAFSLGATDYCIKPFQASILVQKIKKALHDKTFPKLSLENYNDSRVNVTFKTTIRALSEVSFSLEAPVNIAPFSNVAVSSKFLDELNIPVPMYKSSNRNSRFIGNGLYFSEINFIGLTHETAVTLRKALRKLR